MARVMRAIIVMGEPAAAWDNRTKRTKALKKPRTFADTLKEQAAAGQAAECK